MAYTPTTWTDDTPATTPVKYIVTDDTAGVVAASATIATVTSITPGTAMSAANLNNIEQGIVDVETAVNAVQAQADTGVPKLFTAKGQIAIATASNAAAALAVGSNGYRLMAASGEATGVLWTPLLTQGTWTSPNWDGDGKTKNTTYTITASSEFSIPAGCQMILVNIGGTWNTLGSGTEYMYIAKPTAIAPGTAFALLRSYFQTVAAFTAAWIPLDAAGQFCVRTVGSYDVTNAYLTVLAYML